MYTWWSLSGISQTLHYHMFHKTKQKNRFCDQVSVGNTGLTKPISLLHEFSEPWEAHAPRLTVVAFQTSWLWNPFNIPWEGFWEVLTYSKRLNGGLRSLAVQNLILAFRECVWVSVCWLRIRVHQSRSGSAMGCSPLPTEYVRLSFLSQEWGETSLLCGGDHI